MIRRRFPAPMGIQRDRKVRETWRNIRFRDLFRGCLASRGRGNIFLFALVDWFHFARLGEQYLKRRSREITRSVNWENSPFVSAQLYSWVVVISFQSAFLIIKSKSFWTDAILWWFFTKRVLAINIWRLLSMFSGSFHAEESTRLKSQVVNTNYK